MPDDDRIKMAPQEPPVIAQFNAEEDEWELRIDDQWVRISHLIDTLVEMRTILDLQFKDRDEIP